jgi:hypothetical protein
MPGSSKDVSPQPPEPEQAGCLSIIARLIWLAGGNFALLILLAFIAQKSGFSSLDIVFWAVIAALLFIRYADIKWLKGQGPDVQPATMRDWAKYARLLLIIAGGAWAAVHIVVLLLFR